MTSTLTKIGHAREELDAALTNSERGTMACDAMWLLRYGLRLRPRRSARAPGRGSLFHSMVEAQRTGRNPLVVAWDARDKALAEPDGDHPHPDDIAWAEDAIVRYSKHWQAHVEDFVMWGEVEQTMVAPLLDARGRPTRRKIAGKIDAIAARRDGSWWLVDTKTTSEPLDQWHRINGASQQAYQYAILLRTRRPDIRLQGICYDLVHTKPCSTIRVNKDGTLASPGDGLLSVLADDFRAAVEASPGGWDGKPWYRDQYERLVAAEKQGRWFRREFAHFDPVQMRRVETELAAAWRKRAALARKAEPYRVFIQNSPDPWDALVQAVQFSGHDFPRNPGQCVGRFGRLCDYYDVCHSPSPLAELTFTLGGQAHAELDEDTSANPETTR
jgi:hypothetical protein